MSEQVIANINFYCPEHGGLQSPPFGHLAAPARLHGETDEYTLLMDFIYVLDRQRVAHIEYLTDAGPSERLVAGCTFEILQGADVIGQGIVTRPKG